MIDPRDTVAPIQKEWEEFRASFAGALLHLWLLKDLQEIAPDYPRALLRRMEEAQDIVDVMWPDDPDPGYPIPSPLHDEGSIEYEWWSGSSFRQLQQQLFPHGFRTPEGDFELMSRGFLVVALHSAFEKLCSDLRVHSHGSLPQSLQRWFSDRNRKELLSATEIDQVRDLDATRHLYVHNRGIVNERYIRQVSGSGLNVGEHRVLRSREVYEMADVIWVVGRKIVALLDASVLQRPDD